jgi:type II protein arginine methyltransferase
MSAFISHCTLEHLARLAQPQPSDLSERTPSLRALAGARAKGYDGICLPLTNDKWKARWRSLCLLPDDENPDKAALEQHAEQWRANPSFSRDEVTITLIGACAQTILDVYEHISHIAYMDAFLFMSTDEAENAVILLSDWLELDAPDDWVRHDAEIVRLPSLHVQTAPKSSFPVDYRVCRL